MHEKQRLRVFESHARTDSGHLICFEQSRSRGYRRGFRGILYESVPREYQILFEAGHRSDLDKVRNIGTIRATAVHYHDVGGQNMYDRQHIFTSQNKVPPRNSTVHMLRRKSHLYRSKRKRNRA